MTPEQIQAIASKRFARKKDTLTLIDEVNRLTARCDRLSKLHEKYNGMKNALGLFADKMRVGPPKGTNRYKWRRHAAANSYGLFRHMTALVVEFRTILEGDDERDPEVEKD